MRWTSNIPYANVSFSNQILLWKNIPTFLTRSNKLGNIQFQFFYNHFFQMKISTKFICSWLILRIPKDKFKRIAVVLFPVYRFSINFTLECCPIPLNVAYHFKTNFVDNTVTHNYKTVGIWNDEVVEENTWIQGSGNKIIHSVVCKLVIFFLLISHTHKHFLTIININIHLYM